MTANPLTLTTFYKGWDVYQRHLVTAIAPLSPDQLTLRAAPHLWSIGMIATHIVATRVGWFHMWMGAGSSDLAPLATWDEDEQPSRPAAELVAGLESTWQMIQHALNEMCGEECSSRMTCLSKNPTSESRCSPRATPFPGRTRG